MIMEGIYQKVYNLLRMIPRGKVTTYGEVARKLGINPRYVGKVLSLNEHPTLFPCYKVVRSNGEVGGYTKDGKSNLNTSKIKAAKIAQDDIQVIRGRVKREFIYKF